MQRIGLALSGGGFRAVLYHLGVVRFLRDAGLLSKVSHITSVSGGSVLGAHLVLNWDRYCGSDEEFDRASEEVLNFLQLDVRNRIVRRFPFASMINMGRRTLRMTTRRQYTRAGLLEQHYERFLYGDTGLFNLPVSPRLYILATNLSEGSLCAFHRDGMLLQRRVRGRKLYLEEVEIGLATVPMAVAASSAFPGFFPPLELRGWEVGAREGEFSRHAFTDGGIYDNVGLRMFRHIQQTAFRSSTVPGLSEVIDADALSSAILSAEQSPVNSPIRELAARIRESGLDLETLTTLPEVQERARVLLERLGTIMRTDELYRDATFRGIELTNPNAKSLLQDLNASPEKPALRDRVWLNRQIVAKALQQAAGKPCLKPGHDGFDCILVSDAGATFKVRADRRAGGLLSTAMRSSDILMDRVNQLELESFRNTPGVLFFPITNTVTQAQDPEAPHPEVQRHAALIRTDMDRFSGLEVSALVQHGYCVARQACRQHSPLQITEYPESRPWDPLNSTTAEGRASSDAALLCDESQALTAARELQRSSHRRTVRTLLSFRDWPTYVWVPLVVTLVSILPYLLYRSNRKAVQQGYVLSAVAQTSPMYRTILELLSDGPPRDLKPVDFEEVDSMEPHTVTGFEILSDDRIYDLRAWSAEDDTTSAGLYAHARIRVRRSEGEVDNSEIRLQSASLDDELILEVLPASLNPTYTRMKEDGLYLWEVSLDFSRIPIGSDTVFITDTILASDAADQIDGLGRFRFKITADTGLMRIWMLMPEGREYDRFEISGYPIGQPGLAEIIVPSTTVELPIGAIATFQLINPKHNYQYECRWKWKQ